MRDFLLTVCAAVVAVIIVVGMLYLVSGAVPGHAEIHSKLIEIENRQIRIEQLLTFR